MIRHALWLPLIFFVSFRAAVPAGEQPGWKFSIRDWERFFPPIPSLLRPGRLPAPFLQRNLPYTYRLPRFPMPFLPNGWKWNTRRLFPPGTRMRPLPFPLPNP